MNVAHTAAIILAAGLSSRMGALKPLLPLGRETALCRCVRLLREAGADPVLAVTGREADRMSEAAREAGAVPVHNPDYARGMFSSVLAGTAALPGDADAFFVLPADIPLVRKGVPAALLRAAENAPETVRLVRPFFRGRPGHPPLLSRALVPRILAHDGTMGLAGALSPLEGAPGAILDLPVPDANILFDMDRPWDYLRALARVDRLDVPSPAECAAFFDALPDKGKAHALAVALRADAMARAVNANRTPAKRLDRALIRAAALLHDLAKGQKNHEARGGEELRFWGFSRAADIVAAHKDPVPAAGEPVNEREVTALADKLVRCDRPVDIAGRFGEKLAVYGSDPEAAAAIRRRRDNAFAVRDRIEAEAGKPLADILTGAGLA